MTDPVAGLREMGRVTRPGGVVTACVWDHAGGGSPLSLFWEVAQGLDPAAPHEADLPGTSEGHLAEIAGAAGLADIESSALRVSVPLLVVRRVVGAVPAGRRARSAPTSRPSTTTTGSALYERCIELLPDPPFEQEAVAWNVRALA